MEEKNINKKIRIRITILSLVLLLLTILGVTYAYFTIQITGNDTASSIILTTSDMSLIYRDVQIVMGEYEQPGWTDSKVFTVENNGTVTVQYIIKWRELENTLTNNELVISATCTSSVQGNTCNNIPETAIPNAPTEQRNVFVFGPVSIDPGEIHTYNLTTLFKETGSVQNYNQNKYFNGTLNIGEYEPPFKRVGTDSTTGLPVVKIDSEEFYDITNAINYSSLISTNGNIYNYASDKSILLAKYNLYVGQTCIDASSCTPISTSASGYGLQSEDAKGYINTSSPRIGVVPFSGSSSSNGYWYDSANGTIYSKYGTSYSVNNIYDTDYASAPNYSVAFSNNAGNANYSIAYYVEEYVNRLGIDGTGRLLTYTEANAMTQAQRTNGARYWLGSASSSNYVRSVNSGGGLGDGYFFTASGCGVRPVIVVNASDIQ